MKTFLKNYKSTLILLAAIIVGAIVGIIFKEKATVLSPLGDIFLNMLLVIIVPLIFFNITTAITKMKQPKRLGKIIASIIGVFLVISFIAVLIGFATTKFIPLVDGEDGEKIQASMTSDEEELDSEMNLADKTVSLLTVNDFAKLFSKENIIALLVFSIIVGVAINMTGEKAEAFKNFIISANDVMTNVVKIIMYYAPIGLGCYIASFIGSFGSAIAIGYLKTFVVYLVVSILYFIIMYTLYAFIAGGKKGVVAFWKNVLPAAATAIGTCSSAACIPVNIEASKKMGVPDDIAETTVPLGTSFHKDGSIIGSVFKLMFLVYLFATPLATAGDIFAVLGISLLATLLVTAVPIGGGTISEMLILTMMGYPVAALPILTIIATIIDAPATMLNVVGDDVSSMLVARIVDGKDWIRK
jgi:Na+/H+-dicarboxylate symporter